MGFFSVLLVGAALVGHLVLWVSIINRLHGIGWRRWLVDAITFGCFVAIAGLPIAAAVASAVAPSQSAYADWVTVYGVLCLGMLAIGILTRVVWAWHPERRGVVQSESAADISLPSPDELASGVPAKLSRLLGNQVFDLQLTEKELLMPLLPPALDGLRIAQLTDLHMSGRIGVDYFRAAAEAATSAQPDLIALTGDLVEHTPQLNWIEPTLGQLRAEHDVWFVLGNHDTHVDSTELRRRLVDGGARDVGGGYGDCEVRGVRVRLVGNEAPWFLPIGDPAGDGTPADFTIALVHGPDQVAWADRHGIGLVLAGHNHGGQIQLPLLGPIVAPSLSGVRYASGVFCRGQTVMHVSRGTGSLAPLRWNCPPEVAVLTLRSPL